MVVLPIPVAFGKWLHFPVPHFFICRWVIGLSGGINTSYLYCKQCRAHWGAAQRSLTVSSPALHLLSSSLLTDGRASCLALLTFTPYIPPTLMLYRQSRHHIPLPRILQWLFAAPGTKCKLPNRPSRLPTWPSPCPSLVHSGHTGHLPSSPRSRDRGCWVGRNKYTNLHFMQFLNQNNRLNQAYLNV